ncbi:class I SAM-dependent methyltransferase [Nitrosospira sp. Nsp13]|uniref:class I SAM-dependent methyltransferase n=1 Tax=Nitrosospira sp. Nsp13 TaxID=1855332 RepID=UPI0008827FB1|nr:class I SAM-dependent methyltransferase [Nitrosospira sp. Nsp13]SCY55749.1 Methyltransferase domain-containing protein [Nitrosospira sp. Nsp13]
MTSPETTAIFTRSWSLYDLLTEYNYMFHREIYRKIEDILKLRGDQGHYRLLDLGCGNARYLAPCLKQAVPVIYEGVDLSEAALAEASGYLAELPGQVFLTRGDLLEAIESTEKTWDVIFTGFAIHHLAPDEKARFFHAAGRCLAENGWLILVDVVREENQDRKSYLDGYLKFMRETWTKVPKDQLEEACAHVHDHDYPECLSTLREMASEAGLHSTQLISRYAQHHTLLFSRSTLEKI